MALSLLASVCVFTANAEDPGLTVNSAAELLEALKTENAQITLGSDIVFNEGYTFAYDEDNAVVTVSDANGTVAKISTGEADGSTPGAVIEGSLDGLTKWTPLENLNGTDIDGAGHTIKGLYVNGSAFAKTIAVGESVKDLKFENTLVLSSGESRTATLAGLLLGDVYNVDFKNSYVVAANVPKYWVVGGAIADQYSSVSGTTETYNPTVDDVTFGGAVFANSVAADNEITVGGVIGHNKGGTVTNCENYATVKIATGKPYAAGGVIGLIEPNAVSVEAAKNGAPRNVYVYNAANYGKISSAQYAGGVIGFIDPYNVSGSDIVIHNVYNNGKVATGTELIGRCNIKHNEVPIGDASFTYGFITHDTTNELVILSPVFEKLSIAKESADKVLAYLNHGATAVKGLKTWTNDNGVMKMTGTKATYDSAFKAKDITTDTSFDKLTIESVKVLNEKELEITFSEAVTLNYQVTSFIRYTSAPGTLAWKDIDGDGKNDPLQFATSLRHNGTSKMIATLSSGVTTSLADILAMKGFESDNYSVAFCIEGLDKVPGTRIVGEIEEIKAVYADKNLVATKPHANGTYDGYYVEITDTDKATVAFTEATALPEVADAVIDVNPTPAVSLKPATDDGVYIKSVTVINETQLEIVFSEAVTAKAGVFAAIRYTDNKLNLCTDSSLSDPNLQFYGNLALDGTAKGIFTYVPSRNGGKTLYDVLSRKGYEKSLYSVYFCIEGLPNLGEEYEYQAGYIDNITSADGSKMLSAVIVNENDKVYEKYYIAITGGENANPEGGEGGAQPEQPSYEVPADSVKIESVKVIDRSTIEITFSEAVKVVRWPFVGIRYTDINHNLCTDSSLDDPNLQFYGSLTFNGNKATFTYDPEHSLNRGLSFYEVLTMKGYEDKGYYLEFCLEGLPSDLITAPKEGYLDNIVSEADNTKLLGANKPIVGGIYDGYYMPIENIENAKPGEVVPPADGPDFTTSEGGVKLEYVKAIDKVTLELKFSEPIKTVGNVFRGIRYVDKDFGLQRDESLKDPHLQWYGATFTIDANDSSKATWVYNPDDAANKGKTLYEVLTMKGYEDKGYFLTFCFEGLAHESIASPVKGYVDNIQSVDGTKLLAANKPIVGGIYDGCYVPITGIENAIPSEGGGNTPPSEIEVSTYQELAAALASKSNCTIKVTADIVTNEGVTYTYDASSGKVLVKNGETTIAEYGTGKKDTVAGELISGSIDGLAKWTALTINNSNTVDFQGHKVSGYVLASSLFTDVDKSATLKNINVENVFLYAKNAPRIRVGVLAGTNYGVIDTASIKDSVALVANCKSTYAGMAIGYMQSTKMAGAETFNPTANNIRTDGTFIYSHTDGGAPCIGGIIGKVNGGKLTNSVNSADVIHTGTVSYGTGGLVGLVEFDSGVITEDTDKSTKTVTNIYIMNCANYGTIDVMPGMHGAGLIGYCDLIWSVSSTLTVNNIYNGGKLINCASPFIARSQGYTSLGGGTISCDYFFTNSELDNPFVLPTGRFICEVIMKCEQDYALECLNGNVGRLTDIGGLEGLNAWAWVEDGDIIVPDAAAEIPEIAPKPDLPPVAPAEPDFTTTDGGVKIESVTAIDPQTIEVVFSEDVEIVSTFFIALRYVDANFNLMRDPALKDPNLQFYGKSTTISGNKLTWIYDPSQNYDKTLYDILTYKGYENLGYRVTFCIEGLPDTTNIPKPVSGYVDNIRSKADPKKLLAANKPIVGGIYDGCYAPITGTENTIPPEAGENPGKPTVDMTPTENGITILSVKAINETQLEITFSEPVKNNSTVFSAIRYTNSSLKLAQDISLEDPNLQFYGGLKFDGTNKAIFTFNPTDNRCLYDILNRRGYESKNYFVYFCLEGLPSDKVPNPKVGYIDNVTSLDGTKLLAANKPTSAAGVYDGYYVEIEDGNKTKPADYTKKPFYDVEPLSAKLLNEREIEVTFSEPVRLVGNVFCAIRYVDENNNLRWDNGTPLQFDLSVRFNNSRKAIFTLKENVSLTMEEILSFAGYEDSGYFVKFALEGLPTDSIKSPIRGYIDNIQTYDGRGVLLANKLNTNVTDKIYDGLYLDIEDQENATVEFTEATPLPEPEVPVIPLDPEVLEVPEDSIKIVSCQVINSSQIKIVFSQSIETQGAMFKAVRYVDRNLNLQWVNGQPLQFWEFDLTKSEGNTMIYTWNRTDKSLKDVITMKGYENAGYYLTWCFEGLPGNGINNPKPGYVDNIKAKGGTKLLGANKYHAGGVFDGCYAPITGLENISKPGPKPGYVEIKNRPHLTLQSCKVINPSQIELIFSEPIKTAGGLFAAIRYTNKECIVQRDESLKDPYLQFYGDLAIDGSERAVWTLSGSSEKTLYEILNKKGYEKSGYYVYFCLEGLPTAPTKEPGYIDNIVSLDGKKLLKGSPDRANAGGIYDGLYVKIENVEMAVPIEVPDLEGIFVDQIELITPYKLEFVFSEPVYIVGLGTEATQYQALQASVRYVDPKTYETITYNNRIMQFPADFYIEDGDTIGLFELRDQETTIKELFDMVDYEDLKDIAMPVLCLEGTPDMDLIPTPYPGYIDNVQNKDGTNMLTAMIAHGGGIYDAWIATADEINLEVRKTEIELLKELVATDKMSKTELEAFAAMDEATLKEKLTKAKGLLEALKSGEMTDAGVAAFNALLAKNGIDNAEKVKAMMFTVGETFDVGLPMLINLDVRDREYDWSDTVYVYRVNADGSVTEIAQKGMIVYVADEIITRIEFADTVLGDYFVTNSHLELPKPFNPAIIAYIAIGVIALALIALVIFLASKKKKKA